MKNKNPLYVVKKDHVEAAESYGEYIIKKLGFEPAIEFLGQMLQMLLESVHSYATLEVAKRMLEKFQGLFEKIFRHFRPAFT